MSPELLAMLTEEERDLYTYSEGYTKDSVYLPTQLTAIAVVEALESLAQSRADNKTLANEVVRLNKNLGEYSEMICNEVVKRKKELEQSRADLAKCRAWIKRKQYESGPENREGECCDCRELEGSPCSPDCALAEIVKGG